MLDPSRLSGVEARLRAVEERTGVQVVVASLDRADVYHGLRWRAFALGASTAGGFVALGGALDPPQLPAMAGALFPVTAVLGAGLLFALAATLSPAVARLFLEPHRAEAEVRQRAALLFLERELFATGNRTAVLLLACAFERLGVVHADTGLLRRLGHEQRQAVESAMSAHLRAGRQSEGLLTGLDALEQSLIREGFVPDARGPNELPDRPLTGSATP